MFDGHNGFTREQLLVAFEKVQNPINWRHRIDAYAKESDLPVVKAAIVFFTATVATTHRVGNTDLFHVLAQGYNEGPAGDH